MRVEFDVETDEAASTAAVERVRQLANQHLTPGEYETLHVRLYRGKPEQYIQKRDTDIPLDEPDAGELQSS